MAHGYLIVSLAAGLFVDPDPGPVLANYGVDNLRFLTPVKPDDTIAVTLTGQADHARAAAPTTARSAGTPSSSTPRATRWRPTTC